MKMTLKTLKPRNPWVVAALRRVAGAHTPRSGARRNQTRRDLQRELLHLHLSP